MAHELCFDVRRSVSGATGLLLCYRVDYSIYAGKIKLYENTKYSIYSIYFDRSHYLPNGPDLHFTNKSLKQR